MLILGRIARLAGLGRVRGWVLRLFRRASLSARLLHAALCLPASHLEHAAEIGAAELQQHLAAALTEDASSERGGQKEENVLAIDIGGTRTKFLLVTRRGECFRLPPAPTASLWQNASLSSLDKFDPHGAPERIGE